MNEGVLLEVHCTFIHWFVPPLLNRWLSGLQIGQRSSIKESTTRLTRLRLRLSIQVSHYWLSHRASRADVASATSSTRIRASTRRNCTDSLNLDTNSRAPKNLKSHLCTPNGGNFKNIISSTNTSINVFGFRDIFARDLTGTLTLLAACTIKLSNK